MRLLRVTAELGSPLSDTSPLNLDSILTFATGDTRNQVLHRSDDRPPPLDLPVMSLPAVNPTGTALRVHLCSDRRLHDGVSWGDRWTKRTTMDDVQQMAGRTNRRGGAGRDQLKRHRLTAAAAMSWLCWGDSAGVSALLQGVESVGGRRSMGFGRVRKWSVTGVDGEPADAITALRDDDGRYATRAIPAEWCVWPDAVTPLPCSAPYWHRSSVIDCVPPGGLASFRLGVRALLDAAD